MITATWQVHSAGTSHTIRLIISRFCGSTRSPRLLSYLAFLFSLATVESDAPLYDSFKLIHFYSEWQIASRCHQSGTAHRQITADKQKFLCFMAIYMPIEVAIAQSIGYRMAKIVKAWCATWPHRLSSPGSEVTVVRRLVQDPRQRASLSETFQMTDPDEARFWFTLVCDIRTTLIH